MPINCLATDVRSSPPVIYAGAEAGVYRSIDDGTSWHGYGAALPNAAVIDLRLDVSRERLLAATQGRGAWLIDIWQPGDINGDGQVDMADVPELVAVLLGQTVAAGPVHRSDVNADGTPDACDTSVAWLAISTSEPPKSIHTPRPIPASAGKRAPPRPTASRASASFEVRRRTSRARPGCQ